MKEKKFTETKHFLLMVFSFLPGPDLFHRIAVLNSKLRKEIPKSGLLDQEKELTLKVDSVYNGAGPP